MEQQLAEGPCSDAAAGIADRAGLGERCRTFLPTGNLLFGQWQDSRLHVHERGVVVVGPEELIAPYEWRTASVLRLRTNLDGETADDARYALCDPGGLAVAIGPGREVPDAAQQLALGATLVVGGAPFVEAGTWGPHIQRAITAAKLPDVLERIAGGEAAEFGPFRASRRGLEGRKLRASWRDITEVRMVMDTLIFNGSLKRQTLDRESVHSIPDLDLFLAVCAKLKH